MQKTLSQIIKGYKFIAGHLQEPFPHYQHEDTSTASSNIARDTVNPETQLDHVNYWLMV